MVLGRVIRKWVYLLLAAAAAVAGALYLLSSWVPAEYGPARLGRQQREQAASRFYNRVFKFMSDGEDVKPFTWSVSQDWLNRYLSSMDEIAFRKGGKRGQVDRMMTKAHLAEPMIVLADGAVALLARSTQHDKVVSVRLVFEFTPGGKLRVRLADARMGRVPIPTSLLRERIGKLKRTVVKRLLATGAGQEASSAGVAKVLGRLIAAIDGQAIDTELNWRLHSRKRVRICRIDIADGVLTLHVVPVGRGSGQVETRPAGPGSRPVSRLPAGV